MDHSIAIPAGSVTGTGTLTATHIAGAPVHRAVLAFVDILGFRTLVLNAFASQSEDRAALDAALRASKLLAGKATEERARLSAESPLFQATTFSDTIVISDEDTEAGFNRVVESAAQVAASLMWRGRLCRGGIARGLLVHTGDILLGPALLNAYDIEQNVAVYPRIVVDDDLSGITPTGKWRLRRESDCLAFIDVFHRISKFKWNDASVREGLVKARTAIAAHLLEQKNNSRLDVLTKYRWIAQQFNQFAIENPNFKLEQISIA